jgi:hypothetical protein
MRHGHLWRQNHRSFRELSPLSLPDWIRKSLFRCSRYVGCRGYRVTACSGQQSAELLRSHTALRSDPFLRTFSLNDDRYKNIKYRHVSLLWREVLTNVLSLDTTRSQPATFMLVFCNPSIHYACQVYHHFIVTTCFGPLGPSSGD